MRFKHITFDRRVRQAARFAKFFGGVDEEAIFQKRNAAD